MVSDSSKILGLVIKAIKNLRELKGSTSKEILHYISSVYDILPNVARRQMQTALKRGVAYGILKKNGGHYILPTNGDIKCQEIAEQEVNLLDACRRSRMQRKMGCKCKKKGRRRGRKRRFCRCKPRRRVRRRRAARGGCRTRRRRRRSRSRRRRRRKCPCGGTGRSGNLDRLKRAPASEPFDKFCPRKSLEGYDSAVSEKSSLSSVSSME